MEEPNLKNCVFCGEEFDFEKQGVMFVNNDSHIFGFMCSFKCDSIKDKVKREFMIYIGDKNYLDKVGKAQKTKFGLCLGGKNERKQ